MTHSDGDGHELQPAVIQMTTEAEAIWIEAYNDVERRQLPGSDPAGVTAWASKFGEHAARIAGVIARANNPDAKEIDADTMLRAIEVAGFYLGEHLRLMGQSIQRIHQQRLQTLLAWLQERRPRVAHADVLQYVTRSIRNLKAEGHQPVVGRAGATPLHPPQW